MNDARTESPRLLLVDDSPADRELVVRALRRELPDLRIEEVGDPEALARALRFVPFDLAITDYDLGWTDGLDVLRRVHHHAPDCPVILISGAIDEEFAVEAMKAGLSDYIIKDPKRLLRLPSAVRTALERSAEQRRIREAETQRLDLFNHVPVGLYRTEADGRILAANPTAARILGYGEVDALSGTNATAFYVDPAERSEWLRRIDESGGEVEGFEMRFRRRDGRIIWVRNNVRVIRGDDEHPFYEGAIQDITAEKEAAARARESEDRYRQLVQSSPIGIAVHVAGKIRYANPAAASMIGARRPEDVVGRSAIEFVHPDFRQLAIDRMRRSFEEDIPMPPVAERLIRLDGGILDVEISSIPMRDSGERAAQVLIQDVTERERARAALAERARLAEFAADVGRALVDPGTLRDMLQRCAETTVRFTGAAFARIWTLEGETLVLRASAGMYTHLDGPYGRVPLGAFKIGRIASNRTPHLTNHVVGDPQVGDQEWALREGMVAFAGYPLMVEERVVGVVAMFSREELSGAMIEAMAAVANSIALGIERHRQEEALRDALVKAEESDRLKSAFLANMSHEIRTPLNIILGYCDLLRESLGPRVEPSDAECFDSIEDGAARLLATVTGILDLSRLMSGTFEGRPERLDLAEVVGNVLAAFRPAAIRKGLDLSFRDEAPGAAVLFDEYSLSRALSCVLDNAVKFTARGSVQVRITGTASRSFAVEIEDTGVGIDPEFRERVFEPFTQEREGYTRPFEGPGVGLALARRLVELQDARIELESEVGKGSIFRIRFAPESGAPAISPRPSRPASPRRVLRQPPAVLVVEDDESTQTYMQAILSPHYDVLGATSAREARQILEARVDAIDAVLMDISLRGAEDGLTLTRSLRSDSRWSDLPIIAVTAHALPRDRDKALEAGCDEYVSKPFDFEHLLKRIEELLGRRRRSEA